MSTKQGKKQEDTIYLSIAKISLTILAIIWILALIAGIFASGSVGGFYLLIPVIVSPIVIVLAIVLAVIDGINNKS